MTKRLLSVFTLLMMLMMTSLSAHAVSYYLAGDFTNWENGKIEMASDGQGQWVVPAQAVTAGQQFKIIKVDGETTTWYGYTDYHVYAYVVQNATTIDVYEKDLNGNDQGNLDFQVSGIFRFVLTENGDHPSLVISYVPQPVTVKAGIHGNVSVDPTQAIPAQTVTITATPNDGYYIEVGNITVEKTINGGSAQAPGLKADGPGVGQFVTDIQAGEAPNTFTFAMPESPFGAKVSAEFQACIPITAAMIQPNPIPDQDHTGSQIKPAIVVKDGETTLIVGTDYTLEYGANVDPGEGTIIVTGKGKYTGTVTLTFTIKQGVHNVNITTDGNGQVTAEPTSAVQGTSITLTIAPNTGYELDKLTVDGNEVTVTGNTCTFSMPDADVAVNATFKKVDYTITVTSNEYGTVTVNDNKTTANFGDNITLTITPNEDCVLQELKVDGQVVEVVGNTYTFTMPSHNVAVEATFRALEVSYQVNYGKGNPWAQVNEIALVKGTDGKWTAADKEIPAEYEAVLVKKVEGQSDVLLGAQSSGDFYINDNTLGQPISMGTFDGGHFNLYFPNAGIYNFSYDPAGKTLVVTGDYVYNITVTNPATEVAVDKTTAKAGETVTITVLSIPEGYEIDAVKVNDGAVLVTLDEETGKYTFAMPAGNATVTVTFKAKAYELTVTSNEYGKVTVKDKELVENKTTAAFEESITLNIAANEDCVLQELKVDGQVVEVVGNTYTFTMPSHNVAVEATFRALEVSYQINYGKGKPWAQVNEIALVKGTDGKWTAADKEIPAEYEAVLVKKVEGQSDVLLGTLANGDYWITADYLANPVELPMSNIDADHHNLYFPNAGIYNFSYDPAEKKLVVTGDFIYTITVTNPATEVAVDKTTAKAGETVTITVLSIPEGYEIDAVKVNDGAVVVTLDEETGKYTFAMPAGNATVTVTFKAKAYELTVTSNEYGKVTVKDKELVENKTTAAFEESITLNIAANEDCVLDKLMVDGVDVTSQVSNNTYTFSMPSHNVAVEATFRALTITYEIHWGITPEGATSWAEDHVIPMTKRDDGGWVAINQAMPDRSEFKVVKKSQDGDNEPVLTWYGAQADGMYWITADNLGFEIQLGSEQGYNNLYFPDGGNYTFNFNPVNNRLAVTGSVLYDITYSVGPGGTVTADKTQAVCQEIVTVTVTPNPGYEIDELKYTFEVRLPDGTPTGSHATNPIENGQFSMPASDVTIIATFKLKDYTITLLGGQPAHATVTVPAIAHLGEEVTVTVEPDPGYEVQEMRYAFTAAPEGTGGQGVHVDYPIENGKFTMPAADVTISVTIKKIDYTITVAEMQNGTVEAPSTATVGDEVTLTVTPAEGYELETLTYTVEGSEPVEIQNNKFNMPAANVTINATFKTILDYYSLKFDAELEGGTVAVRAEIVGDIESMDKVPAGAGVEVTVTPDEGYEIESFKVVEGITFVPGDDPWGGEFGAPVLKGNGDEVSYTIEDGVYCFPMPNNDATILVSFKQTQYELEGVTFTADRQWATYYNGTKNLALPEGVKAYVVNSVINDAVDITEIDYIPAGVGVLLYSDKAAEQVMTTAYTGETGIYTSKLVGSDEAQAITAGYVLYNNNFIRSEAGTVAAHRCYLPATQVAGAPRILKIGYDGDVPTAIETLIAEGNVAKVMYVNMSGLTSDKPFQGINIAVVTFTDGSTKTIKLVK